MIILTRLGGGMPLALNPDLIQRAEPTPDTVLTLVDGHKLVISESVPELVELIRQWRASVAASAYALTHARLVQEGLEPDDELPADDVNAHDVLGNSLARVFKLPPREG